MSQLESSAEEWRKSMRCDSNACVEVAQVAGGVSPGRMVAVRDNSRPETQLSFDAASWRALLHDLRGGRFDR